MKRALVTGAYGFVGRHVARAAAARGHHVTAMGHGSWGRDEWKGWGISDWHAVDVTVDTLTTYAGKPDVVFHCAGSGSVAFSMAYPYHDYQRTVATTLSVLEYLRTTHAGARLVIPSSAGVYGVAEEMPIRVADRLNPVSPYGIHKKMAEDLCRSYGRHFGIQVALIRLFSVYGAGMRKQLLWDACRKISEGDLVFGGTGEETRDWLHVDDAAALMLLAADHASDLCPVANGGTGEPRTIREVVDLVARQLGCAQRPSFSRSVRAGDPMHYHADISEPLSWGWRAQRRWLEEVAGYVRWFRDDAP
ncbi:MAG TPA: SDR family oxidoreductase [Vineibacter sp.]|nr:SDR family oxidoreductase [Vineibacter sp.]